MGAPGNRHEPLLSAGRVAIITGASSGIGEAFAKALGARGLRLILTGRDAARLAAVAEEIVATHSVEVEQVLVDLAAPDGPSQLKAAVDALGIEPDILVNNAGAGYIGTFIELPLDGQLAAIRLNVEALVTLTGLFLPGMLERGQGGIINTSSAAGLQPLPHYAIYGATKAFVNSFTQALWAEVRGRGVQVVAVCPGPVADTRFGERAGGSSLDKFPGLAESRKIPRERVVEEALAGLERNAPLVVPGLANRLLAGIASFVPRRVQLVATEWVFRPKQAGAPSDTPGAPSHTQGRTA
ncbi:MAG: SDR family oxidoreductase [Chloroflexi bacterium]|nr:SDR family oxidoreductase [Chloroflexota bacterium]